MVPVVKNLPANPGYIRGVGSIPQSGIFLGEGHSNPFQYSYLENPMDRGAWWTAVHRVAQSQTWLKRLSTHTNPYFRIQWTLRQIFCVLLVVDTFSLQKAVEMVRSQVNMEEEAKLHGPIRSNFEVFSVWLLVLVIKNLSANVGDLRDVGLILGSGRSPGGGNGNPLQYPCLENPMDRGALRATVHGITKNGHNWSNLAQHSTLCDLWSGFILEKRNLSMDQYWGCRSCSFQGISLICWACFSDVMISPGLRKL